MRCRIHEYLKSQLLRSARTLLTAAPIRGTWFLLGALILAPGALQGSALADLIVFRGLTHESLGNASLTLVGTPETGELVAGADWATDGKAPEELANLVEIAGKTDHFRPRVISLDDGGRDGILVYVETDPSGGTARGWTSAGLSD